MTVPTPSTPQPSTVLGDEPALEELALDPSIAEHWELWSTVIGRLALPRIQRVKETIPEVSSAMLCTADGLNLCSLGIAREDIGRMAALNSSMFAIASSQAEIVEQGGASPTQTMVSVTTGRGHVVLASFVQPPLGQLLLALAADTAQLGLLVVHTRKAAVDVQEWLTEAQKTAPGL